MPHPSSPLSSPASTALPVSSISPISSISPVSPHKASRLSTLLLPVLAMLLAALLTACGGGGGDKTGGSIPKTYTASCSDGSTRTSSTSLADAQALCPSNKPVDSTSNNLTGSAPILTSQPTDPGYVDAQKVVYDIFNKARGDYGFGYMTRNAKIDQAATAHANYAVVNNYNGHYEVATKDGFTGVDPWARMTAAGYANYAPGSNEVANSVWVYRPGERNTAVITAATQLLTGPYHMAGILGSVGHSDIGIGIPLDVDAGAGYLKGYLVADLGTPLGTRQQSLPEGDVRTYPCEGTTGTSYQLTGEDPNPVPGRFLLTNPIGQPIFVMAARGLTLTIVDVTLTGPDGSSLAVLPTLNSTTDKSGRFIEAHYAAIMPDKPMLPLTRYTVLINGKDNNKPFTRQFSFTTGNTY